MAGPEGLDSGLLSAFRQLQAAAASAGFNIGIGSGYRSAEEQAQLRRDHCCRDPNSSRCSCGPPTAPVGQSNHQRGLAIDIDYHGSKAAANWVNANAGQFGIHFPVGGENWHAELISGGGAGSAATAVGAALGGLGAALSPEEELAERLASIMSVVGMQDSPQMNFDEEDQQMLGKDLTVVPQEGAQAGGQLSGGSGNDPQGFGAYARSLFKKYGWSDDDYNALVWLWNKESGNPKDQSNVTWNPNADNPTSSAYGIAQFLNGTWAGTGFKKTSDPMTQIQAGLEYIAGRYGNPREALNFHLSHNWY